MKMKSVLLMTFIFVGNVASAESDRQCELLAKLTAIRMYSAAEDYSSVGNKLSDMAEAIEVINNAPATSISASDIVVEEESVTQLEHPTQGSNLNHDIRKIVKISVYPNAERRVLTPFLRMTIEGKSYGVDKTSGKLLIGTCQVRSTTALVN